MVNQWGREGKWLVHCHSGCKSGESLKSADEVPFGLVRNLRFMYLSIGGLCGGANIFFRDLDASKW
jgi:hypothetical protein